MDAATCYKILDEKLFLSARTLKMGLSAWQWSTKPTIAKDESH